MGDTSQGPAPFPMNRADMKKLDTDIYNILIQFEKTREWADLTNCLIKLNRILRNSQGSYVPYKETVCKRLAQCLNHQLPNGVHTRALEVYDAILDKIPPEGLSEDLALFSTGLFPFFSYSSFSVRPQFLQLIEKYYIPLGPKLLPCLIGLLICILPGLEDEKSDTYDMVYDLVEKISMCVPEKYFMRSLWLILRRAPKIRLPTLYFISNKLGPGVPSLPEERLELLLPAKNELVLKSLIAGTRDESIITLRELVNFMCRHFPLSSDTFTYHNKCKLCFSFLKLLRKRDWSLTRHIYQWLFNTNDLNESVESIDLAYFTDHSKSVIITAVKELLKTHVASLDEALAPLKIIITLISDIEVAGIAEKLMPVLCIPILKYVCDCNEDSDWRNAIIHESKIIFNPSLTPPSVVFISIVEEFNKLFLDESYNSLHAWKDILDISSIYLDEMKTLTLCETVLYGLFLLMDNALYKLLRMQVKDQLPVLSHLLRYVSAILLQVENIINREYSYYCFDTGLEGVQESLRLKNLIETQNSCNDRIFKYLDDFYIKSLTYFDNKPKLTPYDVRILDLLNNLTVRLVSIEVNMQVVPIIKTFSESFEFDSNTGSLAKYLLRKATVEVSSKDKKGKASSKGKAAAQNQSLMKDDFMLDGWIVCLLKCCLSPDPAIFCRGIRTFIEIVNLPQRFLLKRFFAMSGLHLRNIILQMWNSLEERFASSHSEIVLILLQLMFSFPEAAVEAESLIIRDLTSPDVTVKINSILRFGVLFRYLHIHAPDHFFFSEAVGHVLDAVEESDPKLHYYARAFLSESIYMLPKLVDPILVYLLKFDFQSEADSHQETGLSGSAQGLASRDSLNSSRSEPVMRRGESRTGSIVSELLSKPSTDRLSSTSQGLNRTDSADSNLGRSSSSERQTDLKSNMTEIVRRFRHLSSIFGREGQAILDIMQRRHVPVEMLKLVQGDALFNELSTNFTQDLSSVTELSESLRTSTVKSDVGPSGAPSVDELSVDGSALVKHVLKSTFGNRPITLTPSVVDAPVDLASASAESVSAEVDQPRVDSSAVDKPPSPTSVSPTPTVGDLSAQDGPSSPVVHPSNHPSSNISRIPSSSNQEGLSSGRGGEGAAEAAPSPTFGCARSPLRTGDSLTGESGRQSCFPRLVDTSNTCYTDESIYNYLDLLVVITLKYICLSVDLERLVKIESVEDILEYQAQLRDSESGSFGHSMYSGAGGHKRSHFVGSGSAVDLSEQDRGMLLRCTAIDFMKLFISCIQPTSSAREVSCLISKYLLLVLFHFHLKDEHIIQTQMIYLLKVVMDRCHQEATTMSKSVSSMIDMASILSADLAANLKSLAGNNEVTPKSQSSTNNIAKDHTTSSIPSFTSTNVNAPLQTFPTGIESLDDDQLERAIPANPLSENPQSSRRRFTNVDASTCPNEARSSVTLSHVYIINVAAIKSRQMENLTRLSDISYFPKVLEMCIGNSARSRCLHLLQTYIDFSIYVLKFMNGPDTVKYASNLIFQFCEDLSAHKEYIGTTGMFYYLRGLYFMFNHVSENYSPPGALPPGKNTKEMNMNTEIQITHEMKGSKSLVRNEQIWQFFGIGTRHKRKSTLETSALPHLDITSILDACITAMLWSKEVRADVRAAPEEAEFPGKHGNADIMNARARYDLGTDARSPGLHYAGVIEGGYQATPPGEIVFESLKEHLGASTHFCSEGNLATKVSQENITKQVVKLLKLIYLKLPYHFIKACIYLWDQSNSDLLNFHATEFATTLDPDNNVFDSLARNFEHISGNKTKTCILLVLSQIRQVTTNSILSHTLDMLETFCKSPEFKQIPGYLILNTNVREASLSEFIYTLTTSNAIKHSDVDATFLELQRWINLVLHFPKQPVVFLWVFCTLVKYEKITACNYAKVLTSFGKRLFNELILVIIYQACGVYSQKVCHWVSRKNYDTMPPVPLQVQIINSSYYLSTLFLSHVSISSQYSALMTPKVASVHAVSQRSGCTLSSQLGASQQSVSPKHTQPRNTGANTPIATVAAVAAAVGVSAYSNMPLSAQITNTSSFVSSRTGSIFGTESLIGGSDGIDYNRVVSENALALLIFFNYEILQLNRRTPITNVLFQTLHKSLTSYILPLLLDRQSPYQRYFTLLLIRYLPYSLYEVPLTNIKKNMLEYINSSHFFRTERNALSVMVEIFRQVASEDCKGIADRMARLDIYTNPPHMNVFSNKTANLVSRVNYLKRLAFVLYACDHDAFANNISNIIERLAETTRYFKNDTLRSKCLFVMRVLLVKTSQENLTTLWPVLLSELIKIFRIYTGGSESERAPAQGDESLLTKGIPGSETPLNAPDKARDAHSQETGGEAGGKGAAEERLSVTVKEKETSRTSEGSTSRASSRLVDREGLRIMENAECPANNKDALVIEAVKIVDIACALRLNEFLVYQWMFINDMFPYNKEAEAGGVLEHGRSSVLRPRGLKKQGDSEDTGADSSTSPPSPSGLEADSGGVSNFRPFLIQVEEMCSDAVKVELKNMISRLYDHSKRPWDLSVDFQQWDENNVRVLMNESVEKELIVPGALDGQTKPINLNQIYKSFKRFQ